jgi:hypothetical protein
MRHWNRLANRIDALALPRGIVSLPVVDMNVRLPLNLIWQKDNSSPLLQKLVTQVQAMERNKR